MKGRDCDCFISMEAANPGAKAMLSSDYRLDSAVRELLADGIYFRKLCVVEQLSEAAAEALADTSLEQAREQ